MRKATKRAAAVTVAVTGFALLGSGCSTDEAKDKADDITSSVSSMTSSLKESPAEETTTSAAPTSTQIAGADGTEYTVEGAILEKYNALDDEARAALGAPTDAAVTNPDGGIFQQFDDGVIVDTETGTYVVWGLIRDKWNELGGSQGELGYPTSDETTNAQGQKETTFEHGTVTWAEGDEEATVVEN
ncbi:MAG TPA: hypothetical protein VK069_05830 [Mycolicibacillus parakoreensis]|nr:hypothetical protein [Mycolicibacillus parakoreensis]